MHPKELRQWIGGCYKAKYFGRRVKNEQLLQVTSLDYGYKPAAAGLAGRNVYATCRDTPVGPGGYPYLTST